MYVAAYLAISMQYKESSHKAKHHGSALNMFQVSTCFNQQLVVFPKKVEIILIDQQIAMLANCS